MPSSRGKKWAVAGVVVALGGAYIAWNWLPSAIFASYPIPTPRLPQPNGYDLFVAARKQFDYRPNDSRLDVDREWQRPPAGRALPPSPTAEWVARHSNVSALYAKALQAEFVHHPVRAQSTDAIESDHYAFRALASFKQAECIARSEQGNHKAAADSALDIFDLGTRVGRGGHLVAALKGYVIESMARRMLGPEIEFLTGAQASSATRRLESIISRRPSFTETLREEKFSTLYGLQTKMNKAVKGQTGEGGVAARLKSIPVLLVSPRRQASLFSGSMDEMIAKAQQPWTQWGQPPQTTALQQKLVDVIHGGRFLHVRTETLGRLILVQLAIHAFRKDAGRYPVRLDELAPKYLKTVPIDPFSNAPLRYTVTGNSYKLWSIGPDLRDDGGQPIVNAGDASSLRGSYLVSKDSLGDVVAGVND